ELYGVTWRMQVWPRSELLAGARSALPQLTLGMGLLMAVLLALAVNLAQTARLRARAVEAANQGLEREISGREQMEEALREAKEAAEAANRAKSEFLASMSHELRTPLGIILGYIDLLLEKTFGSLREEQVDTLRRIDRSARELFDLITAVLDLSRLEAGRLPVEVREVQVPELLEELKAETQEVQERASLEFVWQVEGELPPLQTDPGKVKVVVKNLISNAVKFTKAGSITVAAHNHDGGVEISVADTGVGISQEALGLIFEPFHQVDNSGQLGGTGLGLHIVKRLLELLGGTVTVESEVGRGSTFRVWVPRVLHTP
ncbi:MAG: HAMP domain-containing histidine kinase, partial [Deltaproteobacteria bacterium]